jgi:hypothetical protein
MRARNGQQLPKSLWAIVAMKTAFHPALSGQQFWSRLTMRPELKKRTFFLYEK